MSGRMLAFLLMISLVVGACGGRQATATPAPSPLASPLGTATFTVAAPTPTPTPFPTPPVAEAGDAETSVTTSPLLPDTEADMEATTVQARLLAGLGEPNLNLDFAQVQFVKASQAADGSWRFDATVRHNDQGWDHYADAWDVVVVDPESGQLGQALATRVLAHPHDTEQPFTRSQSNVQIPAEVRYVVVRSKCNVHGYGGQVVLVDLRGDTGDGFDVSRP